jgi:hypothetical protein
MFAEVFHSTIKGIHLALEVKTSFNNSMLAIGSSKKSSSQKHGVPTNSYHWQRQKEEENLHTKVTK